MQAYMKSALPYLGVAAGPQAKLYRAVFKAHRPLAREVWVATVLDLWRGAAFREERYAAIALSGVGAYRAFQDPNLVPLYEEMIVTGAWWDYVDAVAVHHIGPILRSHPAEMGPLLLDWSVSSHLWKRRAAIISQVGAGAALDWDLLVACIDPNTEDRDFFIRKAIGWSLRQHARVEPERVAAYVRANESRLSGLSKREARKHLG